MSRYRATPEQRAAYFAELKWLGLDHATVVRPVCLLMNWGHPLNMSVSERKNRLQWFSLLIETYEGRVALRALTRRERRTSYPDPVAKREAA